MTDEIKVVGKAADAAKEIAKTSGKAIDATGGAARFFDRVMGDLVTDGFGLISDRLKYYRFERAVVLAEKTQRRLLNQGITYNRPVPPKIALPIIENATLEDEDYLHTLWANLLATAIDANAELVLHKHVSVLKSMDLEDARLVSFLYDLSRGEDLPAVSVHSVEKSGFKLSSIQYLYSLGMISVIGYDKNSLGKAFSGNLRSYISNFRIVLDGIDQINEPRPHSRDVDFIVLTDFGVEFCNFTAAHTEQPLLPPSASPT
jgi:hypothetical protein